MSITKEPTASLLEVESISKSFGKTIILDEVSLSLQCNQINSIVGESGCGKTTLLRIIAGHEQPDKGQILIHQKNITYTPPQKRNIGLVFQEYALFPHLDVSKNIAFGLSSMNKQQKSSRVEELLELIGLPDIKKRYPHELSGGQQQRVAIARALAPKPSLLLMDEPFSNLDPIKRKGLRDAIQRITKESNTSTLVVTHDIQDALYISDCLTILQHGKIIQTDTPQKILTNPANSYVKQMIS